MKYAIRALKGVADFYPDGQQGKAQLLRAPDEVSGELAEVKPIEGLSGRAAADMSAPALGVAANEPINNRDGIVEVSGQVMVRHYRGSEFTEYTLKEPMLFSITEQNRITLAIYPLVKEK